MLRTIRRIKLYLDGRKFNNKRKIATGKIEIKQMQEGIKFADDTDKLRDPFALKICSVAICELKDCIGSVKMTNATKTAYAAKVKAANMAKTKATKTSDTAKAEATKAAKIAHVAAVKVVDAVDAVNIAKAKAVKATKVADTAKAEATKAADEAKIAKAQIAKTKNATSKAKATKASNAAKAEATKAVDEAKAKASDAHDADDEANAANIAYTAAVKVADTADVMVVKATKAADIADMAEAKATKVADEAVKMAGTTNVTSKTVIDVVLKSKVLKPVYKKIEKAFGLAFPDGKFTDKRKDYLFSILKGDKADDLFKEIMDSLES